MLFSVEAELLPLVEPELPEVALFEEVLPLDRLLLTEVVNIAINTNIPILKTRIVVPQTAFPILLKNHVYGFLVIGMSFTIRIFLFLPIVAKIDISPIKKMMLLTAANAINTISFVSANIGQKQLGTIPSTVISQDSSTILNHVFVSIFSYDSISFSYSTLWASLYSVILSLNKMPS